LPARRIGMLKHRPIPDPAEDSILVPWEPEWGCGAARFASIAHNRAQGDRPIHTSMLPSVADGRHAKRMAGHMQNLGCLNRLGNVRKESVRTASGGPGLAPEAVVCRKRAALKLARVALTRWKLRPLTR
jgi:hypothetical protein